MPFVAVHIAKGRPLEKRRRLIQLITDAVAEVLEVDRKETWVLLHEHDRDNWGIGGELLSDRQAAKSPDLPDLDSFFKKSAVAKPSQPAPIAKKTASAPPRKPAAKSRPRR